MRRFLVVEIFSVDIDNKANIAHEPVFDSHTYEEAQNWIESQDEPEAFIIRDLFEEQEDEHTLDDYEDYLNVIEDNLYDDDLGG